MENLIIQVIFFFLNASIKTWNFFRLKYFKKEIEKLTIFFYNELETLKKYVVLY